MSCDIQSNLGIKNSRSQTKQRKIGASKEPSAANTLGRKDHGYVVTEEEVGGSEAQNQGYPELFRKLEAGLGNISPCLK